MDITRRRFLSALNCSLHGKEVDWQETFSDQEWLELFHISEQHQVLPMIYEAVYRCPSALQSNQEVFLQFKHRVKQRVMMQVIKTNDFIRLYQFLEKKGLKSLVVKGIVCRNLYPKPDYRMSGDEDIFIAKGQFQDGHRWMLEFGMGLLEPEQDIEAVYEVAYGRPGSPLHIELHKSLFPPESDAYGDFNYFFEDVWERTVEINIDGKNIRTLGYTDHLFYLICHAFKHFLHSGFGIRQVCDIILYANAYGDKVDWSDILHKCQKIHAEMFAAALFEIGSKYLIFDEDKACYSLEWQRLEVDEELLLMDLMDSGVYGGASMSRKHSSNITLNAVSAQKQGKKERGIVLKTVFPSARSLEGRFTYLKKYPWLLPVAWVNRMIKYGLEIQKSPDSDAVNAIEIGNQRLELLKAYKILK